MPDRRWSQRAWGAAVRLGSLIPEEAESRLLATACATALGELAAIARLPVEPGPAGRALLRQTLAGAMPHLAVLCRLVDLDLEEVIEEAVVAQESRRRPASHSPAAAAPTAAQIRQGVLS